jgi:predicted kinase
VQGSDANLTRIERHFHNFKPVLGVGLNIERSQKVRRNTMAAIHKEIEIQRGEEFVWDAIRDVGSIHKRLGAIYGSAIEATLGDVASCCICRQSKTRWLFGLRKLSIFQRLSSD